MKSAVAARLGPRLRAAVEAPAVRRLALAHGPAVGLFTVATLMLLWPMFRSGSPSGVDAPTFLHLAWVVERALTGGLDHLFTDPYWYGGFPYLQSYSPLGYGVVGLVTAASPIPLEVVYRMVVFVAYGAVGVSVYWLALEFGMRRSVAVWSGLLALGSYPLLAGLGLFGWFTTLVALPLGLVGYGLLERANRTGGRRTAVAGGVLFAGCLLVHHMTAFGLALGLVPWGLYQLVAGHVPRKQFVRNAGLFAVGGLVVGGLWAGFFVAHTLGVGFEREVPGNWRFELNEYRMRLLERRIIGSELYPVYLGWMPVILVPGAVLWAFLTRARIAGAAVVLMTLTWFSMGSAANPLINYYPFSGLDVARFSFFMVPFMALFAGYLVSRVLDELQALKALQGRLQAASRVAPGVVAALAVLLLVFPALDVKEGRETLTPVRPGPELEPAMAWLARETDQEATVLAVGFRNWDAYWVPERSGRRIMDGWYDEGASAWRPIREVRFMGWFGQVDAPRLHQIMTERNTDYLLVYQWESCTMPSPCDNSQMYREVVSQNELLFQEQASWPGITGPGITVYRRVAVE